MQNPKADRDPTPGPPKAQIIKNPCPEWPPAKEPESLLAKILKIISGPMEG